MGVSVRVIDSRDEQVIGDFEYAAVPATDSHIVIYRRDVELWSVTAVRMFPRGEGDTGQPGVWVYVRFLDDLN